MCYSAQIWADYRSYIKKYNAKISIGEFLDLLKRRQNGERVNLPKGLTDAFKFDTPQSAQAEECRELVLSFEAAERARIEADLFALRRRLSDAERKLSVKPTKTAANEQRVAGNLIARALGKLDDLNRVEPKARDGRVYSGWYCPVMVRGENGQLVVRPFRYHCRVPGMPANSDAKYPGCYNARRDALDGYWKRVYGRTHAVVVAEAFLEHVQRHKAEGRPLAPGETAESIVIQFAPGDGQLMHLAALWSHWTGKNEAGQPSELLSFAIITDEPPAEVAAAGHDRCPINLKPENVPAWLAAPAQFDYQALLEDKEQPYYQYALAAAA